MLPVLILLQLALAGYELMGCFSDIPSLEVVPLPVVSVDVCTQKCIDLKFKMAVISTTRCMCASVSVGSQRCRLIDPGIKLNVRGFVLMVLLVEVTMSGIWLVT
jgi:hypothetical protein